MVNIIDTPPKVAQETDRDGVSILEIVGCAALLSVLIWSVNSFIANEPIFRTTTLLSSYGPWAVASVAWAVILTLVTKRMALLTAIMVAVLGGAFLPLALFFGGIAREGGTSVVGVLAATIAVTLTSIGTVLTPALPRLLRGIAAIIGFLAILVFFTAAFGQAFLGTLHAG